MESWLTAGSTAGSSPTPLAHCVTCMSFFSAPLWYVCTTRTQMAMTNSGYGTSYVIHLFNLAKPSYSPPNYMHFHRSQAGHKVMCLPGGVWSHLQCTNSKSLPRACALILLLNLWEGASPPAIWATLSTGKALRTPAGSNCPRQLHTRPPPLQLSRFSYRDAFNSGPHPCSLFELRCMYTMSRLDHKTFSLELGLLSWLWIV